ncbi:hypothetical protein [Vulgatibacter incomptus]|uniref:Uncharacterized protein n=1 Tax=Vulgatibacter incomptus TaxID=1391653 RepID=A0A0K1PET0_9BACT|nr:hypothetical protein [Vulgatibacter incomptus]AKU91921.1 hypothetical protein AKJ08_2308 [Vulgatibacter incomptus]
MSGETDEAKKHEGGGALARTKRLALLALIAGLAASTFFLLAERNRRFYFLATEGRRLVVSRGSWLPSWKTAYLPEDPNLAKAYAPIELPSWAAVPEKRFDERQDLDQALFDLLLDWAHRRLVSDDPGALREGGAYVERAALLPGISGDQVARLREVQAEVAFSDGRARLSESIAILQGVNEKLLLAAQVPTGRGREAARLLDRVIAATNTLGDVLARMQGRVEGSEPRGSLDDSGSAPAVTGEAQARSPSAAPAAEEPPRAAAEEDAAAMDGAR